MVEKHDLQKRLIIAASPILVGLLSLYPAASGRQKAKSGDQTIRLNVEMVSLPVVVTNREGVRILDLQKEDFQVFEDGVVQEIAGFGLTDEPVSIALAIDTSGSVEDQLARMQNEAIRFVNQLHPDDSVAIMSFSEDVELHEDWSMDRKRNARGIKETRHGTCTKVYEAVWLALEEVLKPVQERTALVLFTDGEDTASHKASQKDTIELAKETKAAIYSVYFQPNIRGYSRGHRRRRFPCRGYRHILLPPPSGGASGCGGFGIGSGGRGYLSELADLTGGRVFDAAGWRTWGLHSSRSPGSWRANTASATTRPTTSATGSSAVSRSR